MASKFELSDTTPGAPSGKVNVKWQFDTLGNISAYVDPPSGGGAVSSVFGRTGAVIAVAGDYDAAKVTNAVDTTQTYSNPAWLTSLAWSKITGAPATGVSTVFGRSGAVTAQSGDYTAAMVTNAVDQTATYSNPAWISALAWSKITGAPSVSSYQSPWLSDIDGASHMLSSASAIGIGIAANTAWPLWVRQNSGSSTGQGLMENDHAVGAGGFNVTNDGGFVAGYMLCGSNYSNSAWRNTLVLYTQSSQPIAFGTNNSEKMRLSAAGNLGIGNAASVLPMGASTAVQVIVGDTAASSARTAMITLATNNPSGAAMGLISFANYNLAATDKRIASIHGVIGATPDSGEMLFYTWNAGSVDERMRITAGGNVGIGTGSPLNTFTVRTGTNWNLGIRHDGTSIGIGSFNDAGSAGQPMHFSAASFSFLTGPVTFNNQMTFTFVVGAANDAAAASAGVPMYGLYHASGALRFRIS